MKRFQFLPILLLVGSLIVLIFMFAFRGIINQQQIADTIETQTVIADAVVPTLPATHTPEATLTPTLEPTLSESTATVTPFPITTLEPGVIVEEGCNVAQFVADITIPDKTEIYADHKYTKTWRMQNAGTCTWTDRYVLYFVSGNKMSGPDKQSAFPVSVEPGQSIDISVELRAPKTAGTYKGFWGLKDQYGNEFGLGILGEPFWVEIVSIN